MPTAPRTSSARIRDHIKKAPPRNERFDLNEAIDEVIDMVRNAIDRNRVSVRTCLMERMASVQGDRVQLQQVVLNLILNAVEAMGSVEEGARELSISTELSPDRAAFSSQCAIRDQELIRNNSIDFSSPSTHKGQRDWDGAVDLSLHHRRPWRPVVGRGQSASRRRISVHSADGSRSFMSYPQRRWRTGEPSEGSASRCSIIHRLGEITNDAILQSAIPDTVVRVSRNENRRNRLPRIDQVPVELGPRSFRAC